MTLFKNVPVCLAGREVAFNQDIKALIVSEGVIPLYLLYYLTANKFKLLDLVDSAGHGTGRLNTDSLKRFPVSIPPSEVQSAIVDLLSTWDQAIGKTERLIVAKERHLSALKQNLLTGHKRIKGYNKSWQRYRLSEVLVEHGALSTGQEKVFSVSVHKGLVNQIEHLGRSFAAKSTANYNLVKPGDIVYTKSPTGDFPYGIIKQSQVDFPVIISPLYGVFTPKTSYLGTFLHYHFESPVNIGNYLRPIIQKGAKNTISITNSAFLTNSLRLPTCKDEIKAIAITLSTARQEIDLLKKQANAYRQQKRGLMQKLLAGQWPAKTKEENV
jgi:type I restriction enzyme S subunit